VAVVSIFVFALLGRPDIQWAILSRILLIPVIAGVSYEIILFSGAHSNNPITPLLAGPGLLLQRLTTRKPDDEQIEVAICAMELALAADRGEEITPEPKSDDQPASADPQGEDEDGNHGHGVTLAKLS